MAYYRCNIYVNMVQYDHGGYAMTLKELRKEKGLTQAACAKVVGVPMRTYVRYEADEEEGIISSTAISLMRCKSTA